MPGVSHAFGPAIAFLKRQRFVVKLSILGVLFLLPLAVALGFAASQIVAGISSCRQELTGISCQRRLFELELAVVRYALMVDVPVSGSTPSAADSSAAYSQIAHTIADLDRFEQTSKYSFLPETNWHDVTACWNEVHPSTVGTAAHKQACERLAFAISVCSHAVANRSDLVSLPHTGLSSLSDSLAIQTRLIHHLGAYTLAPPESPSGVLAAIVELEGAKRGYSMAVFGAIGDNPHLSKSLGLQSASLVTAVDRFSAVIARPGGFDTSAVLATRAMGLSDDYYLAGMTDLERLIAARENDLVRQASGMGVVSAASLILAFYFLIGMYLATMSSVSDLAGKARSLSLGDPIDDLVVVGSDEIAAVGTQALAEIHRNLTEVKSLRREIEEREKVEGALRISETRYRRMFQSNRTVQMLVDPASGVIVDANQAACAFYGYTVAELTSKSVYDINVAGKEAALDALRDAMSNDPLEFNVAHRLASGEVRQVEVRPTAVEVDGRTLLHSIIIDVTDRNKAVAARKAAEAKYEKIFENAIEGIFQSSPNGQFLSANPALARIYGYNSSGDLMSSVQDIGRQLYVDGSRRAELNALLAEQGAVKDFVSQVYRKDGGAIWIEESVRAVRDRNGKIFQYEGTVQDVTARVELEQNRDKMLHEAMERADHDPLTGFLNHRSFHRKLQEEAERAVVEEGSLAIVVLDLDNFKFFNDAYGHLAGDEVLQLVAKTLRAACRPGDTIARFGGDEFALLLADMDAELLPAHIDRLMEVVAKLGYRAPGYDIAIPLTVSAGASIFPDETLDRMEALELADQRMLRSKVGSAEEEEFDRLRRSMSKALSGFSMLDALVTAVDNKDRYTRRHSEDVLTYSIDIARQLGLDERTLHDIRVAALLHDVGKIGVPDYILRKPGKLSDEEFEAIRQHPMMGAIIVAAVPGLEHTLDAVRHHHERWDGEGYPWGLKAEEIPLTARIMAVADAFSAMTTDRPYRKGMPKERAMAILFDGAGTQWDPLCVDAFAQARGVARRPEDHTRPATPLTNVYQPQAA